MIEKEQIEKARSGDLPAVLTRLGAELRPEGRGFSILPHSSLKLFQMRGVWLYKWWARSGEVGDGIQYLRRHHQMTFSAAVEVLSSSPACIGRAIDAPAQAANRTPSETRKTTKDVFHWRSRAEKLAAYAGRQLFTAAGAGALTYLIRRRGLAETTLRRHRLGWLPPKDHMPSKIVIPCRNSRGNLIRVRFRTDRPGPDGCRYRVMKGSCPHSPFPLGISPGKPVIWVESELDGILVHQAAGDVAGVLSLGSASVKLPGRVTDYLARRIPLNLISLDNDDGGRRRTGDLVEKLSNAAPWPVPAGCGKDPGEAWPFMDLNAWVAQGVKWGSRWIDR